MSIPFPPRTCRYYVQGACFLAEARNPGLEDAFLCPKVVRLMRDWDDFVDRAEVFGLTETQAAAIWERLASRQMHIPGECPQRAHPRGASSLAANVGNLPDCAYLVQSLCLLSLPRCEGRCGHYAPQGCPEPAGRA